MRSAPASAGGGRRTPPPPPLSPARHAMSASGRRSLGSTHQSPSSRLASRPDLDEWAAGVAHARYVSRLADEYTGTQLLMASRQRQRHLAASQRGEVRALERIVRTPYAQALEQRAHAAALDAAAAKEATPEFADVAAIHQVLATSMARARGIQPSRSASGIPSTFVHDAQRRELKGAAAAQLFATAVPLWLQPLPNALHGARAAAAAATSPSGRAPRAVSLGALHGFISHMLEEKIQADEVDDRLRHERQTLSAFVEDELWRRYGLRELAQRQRAHYASAARSLAQRSLRVRAFACALGWAAEGCWSEPKGAFYLALLGLLCPVEQIRERLGVPNKVFVSADRVREAVRTALYSKQLEARVLEECVDAQLEPDGGAEWLGGKIDLDLAVWAVLERWSPQWDTIVSHMHRPTYDYDAALIYTSKDAGHYTEQAAAARREEQTRADRLATA